jgi:hypothetical protein
MCSFLVGQVVQGGIVMNWQKWHASVFLQWYTERMESFFFLEWDTGRILSAVYL